MRKGAYHGMSETLKEQDLQSLDKQTLITLLIGANANVTFLQAQVEQLNKNISLLTEEVHNLRTQRFGRSTERNLTEDTSDGQLCFSFNEAEVTIDLNPEIHEPEMEEIHPKAYKRSRKKGQRKEDLKDLPHTVITHELTEEQLLANYDNISDWMDKKNRAINRIDILKRQREQHRATLEEAELALSKTSEGTAAEMYAKTALIIQQISNAFKNAKEENKRRLLDAIEEKSNLFLEKLNTNDFKGTIRIIEKQNGQGEAFLMNNDSVRIFNPNTALKTTYLMSVLFAIGNLSSERDGTELPLLFDAPTSSFTDTKENEFFRVISSLEKQVVIVTKSFLRDGSNGEAILDLSRISDINGSIFRIEKKRPFDDKKLGTIQTTITKIK